MEENIKSEFFGEDEEELEAAKNEPKHERGCNQHECQPGCIVGNKGQIDNKQGVPGLIADKIQHPAQWKPIIMPDKITAENARAKLAKGIHVKNPLGEEVVLDNRIIEHWEKANKEESDINERLASLPLIEELIKNPAEIWEDENSKRTYLSSVIDLYQQGKRYIVAFTYDDDNSVIETYWTESNQIENKRVGKKLYDSAVVSGT